MKNKRGEYPIDLAECLGLASEIPELRDEAIEKARAKNSGSLSSMSMDSSIQSEYPLGFT